MANPPPPYSNITGISRTVMKDNAQETIVNYDGNARPGEIVVDLTTNPPTPYIGNNLGELTLLTSAGSYGNTQVAQFLESGLVGNIIPAGNNINSLGNATNQWNGLYISNTTIYMNSVPISLGPGNTLTVDGNAVLSNGGTTSISTTGTITANSFIGDGSQLTGISGGTGNLDITGTVIEFAVGATEELITISPDGLAGQAMLQIPRDTYANVYDTILTNTSGNVRIVSGDGATTYDWRFGTDGNLTLPGNTFAVNYANGTAVQLGGGNANISANVITFNTSAAVSVAPGQMAWNSSDGTVDIGIGYGNVVLQTGQETHYVVRNETGTLIQDGTALYCSGVTPSGRISVDLMTSAIDPVQFLGLATMDINTGVNGVVTWFGYVRGLDTRGTANTAISVGNETWAQGDKLYVHPTAAGKLTKFEPAAPNAKICVASVIIRNQNSGVLFVRPTTNLRITDHSDVEITTPAVNNFLTYTGNRWENTALDISVDTTPTLGGNLAAAGFDISNVGNITAARLQNDANLVIRSNVAGTAKNWTFDTLGDLSLPVGGNISGSGYVTAQRVITDPLPLAMLTVVAGGRAFASDANLAAAGNFGAQVSGGAGNTVPVWSDGANWYIG